MSDVKPDLNVYILGAGFSSNAGAPLVKDFLDTAREIYDDPNSRLNEDEKLDFQKVFDFRRFVAQSRDKFSIDLDDIEQLFGLIEMSHRLQADVTAVREAMVYVIAKTLQLTVAKQSRKPHIQVGIHNSYRNSNLAWAKSAPRHPSNFDLFVPDIYSHFARLVNGDYDDPDKQKLRSNVVITFNYDLIFDDALRAVGVEPAYGLSHKSIEEPGFTDENARRLSLLKLHGSANWAICGACGAIHILRTKAADPLELRSRACATCKHSKLNLLLVPPSWDKSEYRDAMRPVWKSAVDALKGAKRICVIGYSMPETDMFFKFLLTLGLAENQQLYRLIVIDLLSPGKENDLEARYRAMLEPLFQKRRFLFSGAGFAGFLDQGAATALGRAETIQSAGIFS
ncbi:MAG: hypothetical protein ABSD98_06595 [Candidatus Korobacteraceae bacterium]